MDIKRLPLSEYTDLIERSVVVKNKRDVPAILRTPDDLTIKHVYERGFWSTSTLWPYAKRFTQNAKRLKRLGLLVPDVKQIYHVAEKNCHLLVYPFIEGKSLTDIITDQYNKNLIRDFAVFTANLHSIGIYFRDLHMSNVLYSDGQFGLIDISSVKVYTRPVPFVRRISNVAQILNRKPDRETILKFGPREFCEIYLNHTSYNQIKRFHFYYLLSYRLKKPVQFWNK